MYSKLSYCSVYIHEQRIDFNTLLQKLSHEINKSKLTLLQKPFVHFILTENPFFISMPRGSSYFLALYIPYSGAAQKRISPADFTSPTLFAKIKGKKTISFTLFVRSLEKIANSPVIAEPRGRVRGRNPSSRVCVHCNKDLSPLGSCAAQPAHAHHSLA